MSPHSHAYTLIFPGDSVVKNLPAMQETWVQSLGWEDPLEEGIATNSSILTWRTPMDRGPDGLQSMGHKELDMTEQLSTQLLSQPTIS